MIANEGTSAVDVLDHLLLGISDLDRGIEWCEKTTGIKPVIGGSHPGGGTRNALLSLGKSRYLEIIAPDPAQSEYNFHIDIRKLTEPRLITWAAVTSNIDTLAENAKQSGFEIFGPQAGSRKRPDGKELKWKIFGVTNKFGQQGIEPFPFFIEWSKDTIHPSQDSPTGCDLESFEINHPKSAEVIEALKKLNIKASVTETENAGLIATLKTPKGKIILK